MEPVVFITFGAALAGVLLGWFIANRAAAARLTDARAVAAAQAEAARAQLDERIRGLDGQLADARAAGEKADGEARSLRHSDADKGARIRELETRLAEGERNYEENLVRLNTLVQETDKRLVDQFKALAAEILDEKTTKFTETNRARLDELMNPFRERLQDFQKKVEETHAAEIQGQSLIRHELDRLIKLNQQVSEDAKNLTSALKGESKTQGNWGEMILEKALEISGLEKGREYDVQESRQTEAGERRQPDVVIHLPDNRHLIIDSKVSLVAYERFANADIEAERAAALADHLTSIKNHIKGLDVKNYTAAYGLDAVDFVLMFMPIEPALLAALRAEPELYEFALRKNVVLVSPANLLATLRVVHHVWRLERQNRNVEEIAKLGGLLYDSFVNFADELEKVRRSVTAAGASVDKAFNQLNQGGTSLVRRAERLRELGVKAKKQLPASLTGAPEAEELPDPNRPEEDGPRTH